MANWSDNVPAVDTQAQAAAPAQQAQAPAPKPNGLGVAATAGHMGMSSMAGFGSPMQAAIGAYGNHGEA